MIQSVDGSKCTVLRSSTSESRAGSTIVSWTRLVVELQQTFTMELYRDVTMSDNEIEAMILDHLTEQCAAVIARVHQLKEEAFK